MNECSNIDVAIISTPTNTHVDWIKECTKYNINVFCEKPISKNVSEIIDI